MLLASGDSKTLTDVYEKGKHKQDGPLISGPSSEAGGNDSAFL
jgi:hypothetical protein